MYMKYKCMEKKCLYTKRDTISLDEKAKSATIFHSTCMLIDTPVSTGTILFGKQRVQNEIKDIMPNWNEKWRTLEINGYYLVS